MKLTKGMKKALSLLLSAAMVVTGVNVTAGTASAAGETAPQIYVKAQNLGWSNLESNKVDITGTGDYSVSIASGASFSDKGLTNLGFFEKVEGYDITVSLKNVVVNDVEMAIQHPQSDDAIDYTKLNPNGKNNAFANIWNDDGKQAVIAKSSDEKKVLSYKKEGEDEYIEYKVDGTSTQIESIVYNFTVTKFEKKQEASGGDGDNSNVVSTSAIEVPTTQMTQGEIPEKGSMTEFAVSLAVSQMWDSSIEQKTEYVKVTGNGTYAVTATVPEGMHRIDMTWLVTNLYDKSFPAGFKIKATHFIIGENACVLDDGDGYFIFGDGNYEEKEVRVNILNPYNYLAAGDTMDPNDETKGEVDAFKGNVSKLPVKAGDKIQVIFTVSGMDATKDVLTFGDYTVKATNPPATTNKPTSPSGVTTPGAATPSGIKKITVPKAKKTVVVAPNKTVKVNFTKTLDPSTATKSAVVTADIKSKKVVASATVTEGTTPNKGTVAIKAAKKATKGASTTVTLSSKDAANKTVSAKITVKIQNQAKKVKAAKKSVVIAKKGKTAKLVLKVTAENKKKATTDTVTAKSKVVTIKSAKASKGKITVTLKGKKKGSQTVTFKVGKKKVKVKVTVKK